MKSIAYAVCSALAPIGFAIAQTPPAADPPPEVAAQPEAAGVPKLQEIVVTARRRDENLMQVPVAVSVMSDAAIEERGILDLKQLSQYTPGLYTQTQAQGRADRSQIRLTFRGLSTSGGSIFIDGAPYTGNGVPDVTDVSRVEVLKGPQSVYFGRSTFSGAVNYITKEPGQAFGGHVSGDVYSYNGFNGTASLEGPIFGDRVSARLNVRNFSFGGQYPNGGDKQDMLGKESTKAVSFTVLGRVSDNLKLSAFYSRSLDEDGAPVAAAIKVAGPGAVTNCQLGGTGGPYWCGALPRLDGIDPSAISATDRMSDFTRREIVDNVRGYPTTFDSHWLDHFGIKRQTDHAHLKADMKTTSGWEVGGVLSYSRTQFQGIFDVNIRDTSSRPNPFYARACPAGTTNCLTQTFIQLTTITQSLNNDYSAEVRVSSPQDKPLRATVGTSYFKNDSPSQAGYGIQPSGRLTNAGFGGLKSAVHTPAVFGGIYYDVTPAIKLSAEGRYQWDGITQQQTFPTVSPSLHDVFTSFSPRVSASWSVTPRSLLYGTWSVGYKPGGFNAGLVGLSQNVLAQLSGLSTNLTYEQEKLDNFEIGYKSSWLNNQLRTTIALFDMKWRNGQVSNNQIYTADNGSAAALTVLQNVGRVDLRGVELEAQYAATQNLTLSGTLSYADNKIINYVYSPGGLRIRNSSNVNGNQLDQVPAVTASLSPVYKKQISDNWDGFARLDWNYRSKVYIDPTNVAWIPARGLLNLRIGALNRNGFKMEWYVNNLLGDNNLTEGQRASDSLHGTGTTCPPCVTSSAPATLRGGSILNEIRLGLPAKRSFGVRGTYEF